MKNYYLNKIKAFFMRGVSRSIGESTQDTVMELTQKEIIDGTGQCIFCKYRDNHWESVECRKCRIENTSTQYYG